jgi:hypothetical protein
VRTGSSEEKAFLRTFGLSSLELSSRVLSATRVPPDVIVALRDCEPESLHGMETQHETRLLGLADFAGQLAASCADPHLTVESFIKQTRQLARRYDGLVSGSAQHIKAAFRCADDRLRNYLRYRGSDALPIVSLRRIRQCLEVVDPDVFREGDGSIRSIFARVRNVTGVITLSHIESEQPPLPENPSAPASSPVARTASRTSTTNPPFLDPRQAALGRLRDGFDAQECWHFLRTLGGTNFSGACGLGRWWPAAQPRAVARPDERTVFGVCLAQREPVVIRNAADPALAPYLPDWLREATGARGSFVLVPYIEADTVLGFAFIGWPVAREFTLSQVQLALAREAIAVAHRAGSRPAFAIATR